jgi:hypothetical protein
MASKKSHLCLLTIQSHPNPLNLLSESKLKSVEEHIRKEVGKLGGFDAKSFNIRFDAYHKKHQCFVNFATKQQAIHATKLFDNTKIHGCELKCEYREPNNDKSERNPDVVISKKFYI